MIARSGTAVSTLIEFPSGNPDGNIEWSLLAPDGTLIETGILEVAVDAVSSTIIVPGAFNTLDITELTSYRDLIWTYTVEGQVNNGERRYYIEGRIPFGVSADGVRNKLGVEAFDLPDEDINLVKAFYDFSILVGGTAFAAGVYTDAQQLYLREAIEAIAALTLIPTMQVRVAVKESSGTDTYQRQPVDWGVVADALSSVINSGIVVVIPTFDPLTGLGALFMLAPPAADPITGA